MLQNNKSELERLIVELELTAELKYCAGDYSVFQLTSPSPGREWEERIVDIAYGKSGLIGIRDRKYLSNVSAIFAQSEPLVKFSIFDPHGKTSHLSLTFLDSVEGRGLPTLINPRDKNAVRVGYDREFDPEKGEDMDTQKVIAIDSGSAAFREYRRYRGKKGGGRRKLFKVTELEATPIEYEGSTLDYQRETGAFSVTSPQNAVAKFPNRIRQGRAEYIRDAIRAVNWFMLYGPITDSTPVNYFRKLERA